MKKKPSDSLTVARALLPDSSTADIERIQELGAYVSLRRSIPWMVTVNETASSELFQLVSTLSSLESLRLGRLGKAATPKMLAPLAALRGLKDLAIQHTTLTKAHLEFCLQLEKLDNISLTECALSDGALASLANCQKCTSLELNKSTALKGDGLEHLAGWQKLQTLKIQNAKISDVAFPALASLKKLQHLNLSHNPLTGRGLHNLASLKSLNELFLQDTKLNDAALKSAVGLMAKVFYANGCALYGPGLESLWTWKRLETLGLSRTQVDDSGVQHLAKCKSLKYLELASCPISQEGLMELTRLPLRTLNLSFASAVSDEVLIALSQMKSLRELSLYRVPISDKGMLALSESALRKVELSAQPNVIDGLVYFVGNKQIREICLEGASEKDEKVMKKQQAAIRAAQRKAGVKENFGFY